MARSGINVIRTGTAEKGHMAASGRVERNRARANPWPALALAAALPGCTALESVGNAVGNVVAPPRATPGEAGFVRGFVGGVVAEEPVAAATARNTLSAGGTAVDAAVAGAFTLTVTLPSRAGLGGGGACLVFNARRGEAEAVLFPPGARSGVPAGADRPAAVPLMARGLFALHTRGNRRPFEELIGPAEGAARFGVEVSGALAADLAPVAGPLLSDPWAAQIFSGPGGGPLAAGARLVQPDLAGTLATIRTAGVGDLHNGALARRLEEASAGAGGGLTVPELRAAVPRVAAPLAARAGNDSIAFLPPPADGGLAAAAAFGALRGGAAPDAALVRGLSVTRAFRERGGDPAALIAAELPADPSTPFLPASTGLTVVDREGNAVACAFTMNNLFGTGRVAAGTGVLLAAAPGVGQVTPPLLAAAIAYNANIRGFRAAAVGSGQAAAPIAVALPLARTLAGANAATAVQGVPDPGRAGLLSCAGYLPGEPNTCTGATDPRGAGAALGGMAP